MAPRRLKGVIIREHPVSDTDKIIDILTGPEGKVTAYVRGARKPRSILAGPTQMFCYTEFLLFSGKEMSTVSTAELVEPFRMLREDLVKMTYAAHLTELIQDGSAPETPANRTLRLFLGALHHLDKGDRAPEQVAAAFTMKLMSLLGYTPELAECIACRKPDPCQDWEFSFARCGVLCPECARHEWNTQKLSTGAVRALHFMVSEKVERVFNFQVSEDISAELATLSMRYVSDRNEKRYTRLSLLQPGDAFTIKKKQEKPSE